MYYSTDQCQKTIQNTSRITLGNSLRIRHIKKPSLLCPCRNQGAKQGWFPYIIDNVAFTQESPARDLYAIREKRHRNTGAYQTTHQPRPLPCNTLTTKYLQNSMPLKQHTVLQIFEIQQFTDGGYKIFFAQIISISEESIHP